MRSTTVFTLMICLPWLAGLAPASDEIPGPPQRQPIALVGGTIHTVSGRAIPDGTLVFDAGKITEIGKAGAVKIPQNAKRMDVAGKHVYPGLFDAYSNIGLVEINAVRATRDYSAAGSINPNVKAHVAVNPDSELIPVTRSNGVLLALTAPTGGLISGKSAVLQLDGWTFEDMTLQAEAALHVQWPAMRPVLQWPADKSADEQNKQRDKLLERLQEAFDDTRAYQRSRADEKSPGEFDVRLQALIPVIEGRLPLVVRADGLHQIQSAVAFASREKTRLVILGGYDAPRCAELLIQHNVPVIISAVYRLPRRRHDDYDAAYTLPHRLKQAGVKFCISSSGRFGASNVRNLPYNAATAAAYGLDQHEALRSITLYPAQILGVDDRVGSLEVGKHATLFVADGDILETETQVQSAFIEGRVVDLQDKQKRLWKKYSEKQRQLRP